MRSGKRVILFLDFDGTLSTIVKNPDNACMRPGIRQALRRLSQSPFYKLVIISGRSLKDLRRRVNFKNIIYAGNHGLELSGGGLKTPGGVRAGGEKKTMGMLAEKLRTMFHAWPQILVENKSLTVSLHFRNLPKEYQSAFGELVRFTRNHFRPGQLAWRQGKKVWEIKPRRLEWGKGHAASYIRERYADDLVMAIGDDVTDEDMFKKVNPEGITIRVGRSKRSAAEFYFKSVREVEIFLRKLCD